MRWSVTGLHDHEDGWFYDRLDGPEGTTSIRVQTLVGAIPLLPTAVLRAGDAEVARRLRHRFDRITSQAGGAESRHVHRSADGKTVALGRCTG